MTTKRSREKKMWTEEEMRTLEERWGFMSIEKLAKSMGRPEGGIVNKVVKMKLGTFLTNGDYVSWNQFILALGYTGGYRGKIKSWVDVRGFPLKHKKIGSNTYRVVYLDEFWKWAEKNKAFLDFTNFEENALGAEPEWAKKKRSHDCQKKRSYKKTPWKKIEDEKLIKLVKEKKYTFMELSKIMGRTEGAIQRRVNTLELEDKPLRIQGYASKWEAYEIEELKNLVRDGLSYESMCDKINKSVKAMRGKVYVLYGSENLDRARVRQAELEPCPVTKRKGAKTK